jgi:hypothetical protein
MSKDNSVKEPLFFAAIITTVASFTYSIPFWFRENGAFVESVAILFFTPFLVIAGLYVSAFFIHSGVFLFVPKRTNFKQTLKVLAYSSATSVFMVIPFIGLFIAAIFQIRSNVFGLSAVHNVSAWKIFMLLVIIPIIITTVFVVLIVWLFKSTLISYWNKILPLF